VAKEQRQLAWKLVQEALEAGELARQPCVICGALKVLPHHENYDDPLAITWLCSGKTHHQYSNDYCD
jgi:hypothetical protein